MSREAASATGPPAHVLYLHGFASGPQSAKGRAFERYLRLRSVAIHRLDLRVPNRNELRLSAMIELTSRAADGYEQVAVAGSSLGGLVAAHVAAHHPAVLGALLMAPAFGFADRWAEAFGTSGLARWRSGIPLRVEDHAGGEPLAVDYGFYEDAAQVERAWRPCTAAGRQRDVPVLIFHGRDDATVSISGSRAYAEVHRRAKLVELSDGHPLIDSLPIMLPEGAAFLEALFRRKRP